MRILDFDTWFDKSGENYADSLYDWLERRPLNISLINDLGMYDIDEWVNQKVLDSYEDYVSDFEDMEYDRYKDEKCF